MNRLVIQILLLLALAAKASGQAYMAQNRERSTTVTVPDTLSRVLHKLAPGADSINWEQRSYKGKEYFEVNFHQGHHQTYQEGSITFTPDNSIESYLVGVELDALPLPARQAITRKMARHFWSAPATVAVISRFFYDCALESNAKKKCTNTKFIVALYSSEEKARQEEDMKYFHVSPEGRITMPKLPRRIK